MIDLPGGADVEELSRRFVALKNDLVQYLNLCGWQMTSVRIRENNQTAILHYRRNTQFNLNIILKYKEVILSEITNLNLKLTSERGTLYKRCSTPSRKYHNTHTAEQVLHRSSSAIQKHI